MGQVIVITSGKGGVGKTTTTANIGTALASLGNKVVVIDADIGLRNLDVVLGLENRIVYTLMDVINPDLKKRVAFKKALIKSKHVETLYLLPASQTDDKGDVTPEQMKTLCEALVEEFDFVIVDCPAGIEQGFKNAIAPAQKAVVVCNPEVSSVRDSDRVIGLWDAQRHSDDENGKSSQVKSQAMLIINRVRPKMVERGDMLVEEDILEMLACDLLGRVPEDDKIIVSSNRGEPAVLNKESKAGQAYLNIARRLMGENVPLMPLEEDDSLWRKIKRFVGFGN